MAMKRGKPSQVQTRRRRAKAKDQARTGGSVAGRINTPAELRALIRKLSPESPATDRFSAEWRRIGGRSGAQKEQETPWYKTQHEHWLGWLAEWDGPGAYGRKDWNRSAAFVYNHIVNPKMLVYLAEAIGLPRAQVNDAVAVALANGRTMAAMSGAIRKVVPWDTVEEALLRRSNLGRSPSRG